MKYAKIEEAAGRPQFKLFDSDAEAAAEGFLPFVKLTEPRPEAPPNIIPHNYTKAYKEESGKVVEYWKPYPNYAEIERLEKKLDSTDYRVIKCYEAALVGDEFPYDVNELHAERQEIRDEINRLEECRDA